MNDTRHPARRRDYSTRQAVESVLSTQACRADLRAALLALGVPLQRTLEIVR